jgi:hypothetical protein
MLHLHVNADYMWNCVAFVSLFANYSPRIRFLERIEGALGIVLEFYHINNTLALRLHNPDFCFILYICIITLRSYCQYSAFVMSGLLTTEQLLLSYEEYIH